MALLLQRLNAAFRDDPGIDEYALVPAACPELFGTEGTEADSDVKDLGCIAAQQKLAISIEGALVLYLHAFQAMRRATANEEAVEALESSRAVLLCSADCVGAWKCREKFSAHLNPEAELLFSSLLLRTNHKSGESWSQRRRLLGHMLQTAQEEERQRLLSEELVLLEELAKRYDHHYYAWNHWAWLDRQSLEHAPKTGALLQMDFPKLAFATPSHYGLFHHRLVRLQRQMAGQASEASKSRMELEGLPAAAAFTEEWNLALKLLKTFPHLEAPWAFRAQLFALLMEALDHGAEAETQMQKVGTLWKAEVEHAKRHTEEEESRRRSADSWICRSWVALLARASGRWALQFQVHLLQELGFYLLEAIDDTQATSSTLRRDAQTSLDELKSVEAASPAVLKNIARDLEECNQGYSLLQKQRPTGLGPPILRDFGHYMWGRACLNRICGAVTLEDG